MTASDMDIADDLGYDIDGDLNATANSMRAQPQSNFGDYAKGEMAEMWSAFCLFLINLPQHISYALDSMSKLVGGGMRQLYGRLLERMIGDLDIVHSRRIDRIWKLADSLPEDVTTHLITVYLPTLDSVPKSLLDWIEAVKAHPEMDVEEAEAALRITKDRKIGELWQAINLLNSHKIDIRDALVTELRSRVKPWDFGQFYDYMIANSQLKADASLKRIYQSGVQCFF
jgi:hypothetical protein